MTPRYFIVCNRADLAALTKSQDALKYARFKRLTIVDGHRDKTKWAELYKLRSKGNDVEG